MAGIIEVKVKEIIRRTYNVKSVRLEIKDKLDYKAGQFLCVWLKEEDAYKRYLSISSSPTETGYIEFTKKLTQSDFSKALDALKAGDSVRVQYPLGKFTLDQASEKIAYLSGGIGITPIRSMCQYASDKKLDIDIVLLYANRTAQDVVFKEDFEQMRKDYPNLRVEHILCEATPGFDCTVGMINSQIIRDKISDYAQRKFFICGPPGMVEAMKKILTDELGLDQAQVVTENFQGY